MKVGLASGLWDSSSGRSKLRAEDGWVPPPLHKQLLLKIQYQQEQKLAYTHFLIKIVLDYLFFTASSVSVAKQV